MPRLASSPGSSTDPRLGVLRAWLSLGVLAVLLLPPATWHNHLVGWLPYWLLVAPLISLALLRRQRLVAALSAFLVRGRRRRNLIGRRRVARHPAPTRLRIGRSVAGALIAR